jgi:ubiquinone/menaquinone biosynthesis C-methylase UbiE
MILPREISIEYQQWNKRWHAPWGNPRFTARIPKRFHFNILAGKMIGMFAYQLNSDSRCLEYPWAFYSANLNRNMDVLDVGGGLSGFSFCLNKLHMHCTVVDPFVQYGGNAHYRSNPAEDFQKMNKIFRTNVQLKQCTIDQAGFSASSFDRIFCLSVIEHLSFNDTKQIIREAFRILKPGGLFILSIDLFLNLTPFTKRISNEYGTNIDVNKLLANTEFNMVSGKYSELYGYSEFNFLHILENLEEYYVAHSYPTLTQTIILQKERLC